MKIKAISISDRKGVRKKNIDESVLIENFGLQDDAHGGKWHRQVSFLAEESIEFMREKGLDVVAGNFAENITTEGIDLTSLTVGTHLKIGDTELIISQLGKICHNRCAIYHQAGDCVMPREGIFGVVVKGGPIHVNDSIQLTDTRYDSVAFVLTKKQEKEFGDQLQEIARSRYKTPIIRFDTFNPEKNNLPAIMKDLTEVQKITRAIIFDPELHHGLNLSQLGEKVASDQTFKREETTTYYCKSIDEVKNLAV